MADHDNDGLLNCQEASEFYKNFQWLKQDKYGNYLESSIKEFEIYYESMNSLTPNVNGISWNDYLRADYISS